MSIGDQVGKGRLPCLPGKSRTVSQLRWVLTFPEKRANRNEPGQKPGARQKSQNPLGHTNYLTNLFLGDLLLRLAPNWQRLIQSISTAGKTGRATRTEREYHLPPALPRKTVLIDPSSPWEKIPVTKYWGMARRDGVLRKNRIAEDKNPPLIPSWFRKFDWVVGFPWGFADEAKLPSTILCQTRKLKAFIEWAESRFESYDFSNTKLAVMGMDDAISSMDKWAVDLALEKFDSVYFSANDGSRPQARTVPMALTEHYLRGFERELMRLLRKPQPRKTQLVLAAFGARWPSLNTSDDRAQASRHFVESGLGELRVLPKAEYFDAITRSHYFVYPRGNGIQSPKGFEALMLGSIPIVTRHPLFEELESRGMPLLIIDHWSQLSAQLLEDRLDDLSARVAQFLPLTRSVDLWWEFCFPAERP